jgi:HPt (histidine-containing phosphotransfer) domain-containing protein
LLQINKALVPVEHHRPDKMHLELLSTDPVLDVRGALARLDGDDSLLVDLIGFFLEDSPKMVDDLKQATAAKDSQQLKMSAHALKGLVASCGGARAAAAAQRLENAAAGNDLSEVDSLLESLLRELEQVRQEAEGYIR